MWLIGLGNYIKRSEFVAILEHRLRRYLIDRMLLMQLCERHYICCVYIVHFHDYPDNKVRGANIGPIWGRQDPGGPLVGPMNFAIWVYYGMTGDTISVIKLLCLLYRYLLWMVSVA